MTELLDLRRRLRVELRRAQGAQALHVRAMIARTYWPSFEEAHSQAEQVRQAERSQPASGVAVARVTWTGGARRVVVVDVDPRD